MRKVVARPEERRPITVRDLAPGTYCRTQDSGTDGWRLRTNSPHAPLVAVDDGMVLIDVLDTIVVKVLAPGESLVIGPDE